MKNYYFMDHPVVKKLQKHFGIDKPYALEWGGWTIWKNKVKSEKPFAYFLTETIPNFLDDLVYDVTEIWNRPIRYVRNRYIDRTHIMPTDLEPGEWWDCDSRLVSGMRQLIIDHVEIELAYANYSEKKKFKWENGRSIEAGLDYLNWATGLRYDSSWGVDEDDEKFGELTHQATAASELLEIYNWCKNYNNRPDLMDVSGWSAYCDTLRDRGVGMFDARPTAEEAPDLADMRETSHKKLRELEAQREAEDTEMLCRIVKMRQSLWT